VMTGWMLNAWAAYAIGGSVAHPLLHRLFGAERFGRAEAMVARGGITLLLTVRLIPILPFSLICYAAGAARVPPWRYTWTTAVGYLPITVLSTYLGSRLEHLHPTDPLVIGAVCVVIALLFAVRWLSRALHAEEPAS
ncbi:MAG: VTT domain-containing protein, partial [Actinomycetota bacterium]|nr:VTT domain-containing protein [Actinomycetota bacterium]